MSDFFMCPAYQDMEASLMMADGVLYLSLKAGSDHSSGAHITLNHTQASVLGKYLQLAAGQMSVGDMYRSCKLAGNLTVSVEMPVKETEHALESAGAS